MDNDQVARELLSQEGFNNYKDRGWVKTIDTFNNLYDEKDNPDGIASLASAENVCNRTYLQISLVEL